MRKPIPAAVFPGFPIDPAPYLALAFQNHELRLELAPGQEVSITLEEGSAEVFGTELFKGQKVSLNSQKLAIYSWHGCRLTMEGQPEVQYTAEETPMVRGKAGDWVVLYYTMPQSHTVVLIR